MLVRKRERDRARADADVEHTRLGFRSDERERTLDEDLCLRSRHEGAPVCLQRQAPEAPLAEHVRERLTSFAARDEWLERRFIDLVVANPPYVHAHEWDSLQPEIREWEPRTALVGEGMHEELLHVANARALVLEVGDGQAEAVAAAFGERGYGEIRITRDLSGRERVVEGRRR